MVSRQYADILQAAVDDIAEHGYDDPDRILRWTEAIKAAAEQSLQSPSAIDRMIREAMATIYRRLIDRGIIIKQHPGLSRFTIDMIAPQLRGELDRRILASADLIRLNREEAIRKTLHRFQGWATSVPKGGSYVIDKRKIVGELKKPTATERFHIRRVEIDQGRKLVSSISETIALGNNALAGIWHSRWRVPNYNYREKHKDRDLKVYMIRDNWAIRAGLAKVGPAGYYDEITPVAFEPYCSCSMQWLYALQSLPDEMLTEKGRAELARVRKTA